MKIAIGCPVYERAWILPHWFNHLYHSLFEFSGPWELELFFVYTPSSDDTHLELVNRRWWKRPHIEVVWEGDFSKERNWTQKSRIETMVVLRNRLLNMVREAEPDVFLSLDSDILVPNNFWSLIHHLNNFSAVAPLVYLGQGPVTNAFHEKPRRRERAKPSGGVRSVDVICAAKLMGKKILMDEKVEYSFDHYGEDIAWSRSAREQGYELGWDSSIKTKHIMEPKFLHLVDPRIGW